jgi:small-conductance mechanosensitive channel
MQYSVMHRMLNVLVVLATVGAALMIFEEVRVFGASLLTCEGILRLVAGIAAQRTLQNVFAGLQLGITQPIALGDVVEVENVVGTIEEITFSFVSVRLRDLRRLILPVTYFL